MSKQNTREEEIAALMTPSPGLPEEEALYLTGNEYLSLPEIGDAGEIRSINVLHMGARGLLEFRGTAERPLLVPFITVDGAETLRPQNLVWSYRCDWIPGFETHVTGCCTAAGDIFAPPGRRGGCCRLHLVNRSSAPLEVEMGWQGCWSEFNHIIFNRRPVKSEKTAAYDSWTGSLLLEARSGLPLAALALAISADQGKGSLTGWDCRALPEEAVSFRNALRLEVPPGGSASAALFIAVNLEADGAGTTAVDLKRHGAAALAAETERRLVEQRVEVTDATAAAVLHRNLYFNYFYALGRALDDDSLLPVTSRSPRYYVSAAYWGRDTLLWSFPGLLLADRIVCRELLLSVFSRHLSRAGEHAQYINGALLYPGFELDQLAAHFLALERYESATGDLSLLDEAVIYRGLKLLTEKALQHFDPESGLYRTFLDPSDDPVLYPFLIYDNALLKCAFTYLAALQETGRWEEATDFAGLAGALEKEIYRHGTVMGPRGIMFAWAVDGKGRFQLYDNPPGSLQLLAFYGFCSHEERVFRNTVAWIRSPNNPHFHGESPFSEAGSLHAPKPWPLAACNDILALNEGGGDFLLRAPMDNGFCCETVDPETGRAATGAAFASAAGFMAHALWWAGRNKAETDSKNV